jgi:hypothetical protein
VKLAREVRVAFVAVALLPRSIPARALLGRRLAIGGGGMVVPVRSLGIRHLTHDELARGDLVTYVLKKPLPCVFVSFVSRFGHRLVIV